MPLKTESSESSELDESVDLISTSESKTRVSDLLEEAETSAGKSVFFALLVIVALMLGAGRDTWSLGACYCLIGLGVIISPPVFRLPWQVSLSLVFLMLLPLLGFMPNSWLGLKDPLRQMLWESWGIALPDTISLNPLASLESWLKGMSGLIWLWCCLGQRSSTKGRRWSLYVLAIGGVIIAIASLIDYFWIAIPWWPRLGVSEGGAFGPFANRNHTSSLNAITCILCAASGADAFRRRSTLVWLFAIGSFVPLSAILANTSRGGLLLLLVGTAAWVSTGILKRGGLRKFAVAVAVLLLLGSVAVVSSGRLGTRIRSLIQDEKVSPLTSSMRVELASDTLRLFAERPWLGHGYDTFESTFPMLTNIKVAGVQFLHPESEVLWLMFEGGLLIVIPCVGLLIWIFRSTGPWYKAGSRDKSKERSGRRIRMAAAIAAGMALLHSFFDVPNHVMGYGMSTSLLLGLAIQPRCLTKLSSGIDKWVFRVAGLAIVSLGILWLGMGLKIWTPNLPSSVPVLRERVMQDVQQGQIRDALVHLNRAISISPLDFRLYYQRAQLLLELGQRPETALQDFGRSRALFPHYAKTCFEEGAYWLRYSPGLAMIPWRECLRRLPLGSDTLHWTYQSMLSMTPMHPELRLPLWALAQDTSMQLSFLEFTQTKEEWETYLAKFRELYPRLEELEASQARILMRLWQERGNKEELIQLLEKSPRLQVYGWRAMAFGLAHEARYEEALALANKYMKRQVRPSLVESVNIPKLERAFLFNPTDVRPAIELYYAQRAAGDIKAAKLTAEKVIKLPDVPAYMHLELASIYAEFGDYRRAWESMELAIQSFPDA